jgi:uncharacterized protein YjiS (DUF1127 family)
MKLITKLYQKTTDIMARRRAAIALEAMPDYLLADLGVNRYEIQERVYGNKKSQTGLNVHYIDIEDRHVVGTQMFAG